MRDYRTRNAKKSSEHLTGRICEKPGCKGELKDSVINFGDLLEDHIEDKGN